MNRDFEIPPKIANNNKSRKHKFLLILLIIVILIVLAFALKPILIEYAKSHIIDGCWYPHETHEIPRWE